MRCKTKWLVSVVDLFAVVGPEGKARRAFLRSCALWMAIMLLATGAARADNVQWIKATDFNVGLWSDGSNWAPHAPGPGDNVFLTKTSVTSQVLLDVDATVGTIVIGCNDPAVTPVAGASQSLIINGHTLTINGPSNICGPGGSNGGFLRLQGGQLIVNSVLDAAGQFIWTGGTLGGTGSLTNTGTLTISGDSQKVLNGTTLDNDGIINWSGAGALNGGNGAILNNQSGAAFNLTTDGAPFTTSFSGQPTFNNLSGATFAKTAGSGTNTIFGWVFNHSGTIVVASGIVAFNTSAGLNINGGATFSGAGLSQISGGTATVNGTATANGTTVELAGGIVTGSSGVLARSGTGSWNWTGGEMRGTLSVPSGSLLTVSGGTQKVFNGATLSNAGTVRWNGGGAINGGNAGVINNQNGGEFKLTADGTPLVSSFAPAPTINNLAGALFAKTAGSSTNTIASWVFNNNGIVKCASGILAFNATLNVNNGSTFTGAGRSRVTGGTATFTGSATADGTTVEFAAGTIAGGSGGGTLRQQSGGLYECTGGTFTGTLKVAAGSVLNVKGDIQKVFDGNTLNNAGTINWSGAGAINGGNGAILNNQSGAAFNLTTDGAPFTTSFSGQPTFNNLSGATFAKTAGSGTNGIFSWIFNHSGTVNVPAGTVEFNTDVNLKSGSRFSGAGLSRITGGNATATGTVIAGIAGGTGTLEFAGGSTTGSDAQPGTLTRQGSGVFRWTGGSLLGTFNLPSATKLNITGANQKVLDGATVNNSGTVNWSGPGQINGGNSALFNNTGTFNARTDGTPFVTSFGALPTFDNNGTFAKTGGTSSTAVTTWFFNAGGIVKVASGFFTFSTTLLLKSGVRFLGPNGTFISGGNTTVAGLATVENNAFVELSGTTLFGDFINIPDPDAPGLLIGIPISALATTGGGLWNWTGGEMRGIIVMPVGSQLQIAGANQKVLNGARLDNFGTITWRDAGVINAGNRAVIHNQKNALFQTLGPTQTLVHGFGIRPEFENDGNLEIGAPVGTLNLAGTFDTGRGGGFAFTHRLNMDIGGATPGTQHDQLNVSGSASLGGDLFVRLVNSFVPAPGSSFKVITATSIFGAFFVVTPPFTQVENPNDLTLTVPSGPSLFLNASRNTITEGGPSVSGLLTRNGDLTNPLTVNLTTPDNQLTSPASVIIPAGANSVDFPITAVDDTLVEEPIITGVVAKASGFTQVINSLILFDNDGAAITISIPSPLAEGASATGTVTRNTVTTDELIVTLSSSDGARLLVPETVKIPFGKASADFTVTARENAIDEANPTVTVTASALNVASGSANVVITDNDVPRLTLTLPATITEGSALIGTVARNTANVTNPLVVTVKSNRARLTVPATATIPAGRSAVDFALTAPDNAIVDGNVNATVSATATGFTGANKVVTVNDNDAPTLTLSVTPATIAEGTGTAVATVTRNTATTAALTVNLSSNKTDNATVPATVTIPIGATAANFNVTAPENTLVQGTQAVTLTASATGLASGTISLNITDNDTAGIDSFNPTNGLPSPPLTVVITGANFTSATAVAFNGVTATFTVDSPTQISATLPTSASTGRITVTTPAGTATSATDFVVNPGIKLFTPESGSPGTSVVIEGWGLNGASSVRFNGVAASFTVNTVQKITATVPESATTGPISITTPSGAVTSVEDFVVCAANVTARLVVTRGALQPAGYVGGTFGGANYQQNVTLRNTGATAISGPLSLVLDNLTSGVILVNRNGVTACATPPSSPYVNVGVGSDNVLSPGETVAVTLYFNAPSSDIDFTARVLAGSGSR